MIIGVLALQGSFIEHITVLEKLGYATLQVRTIEDLAQVDGLIMPGGESTAIGKLLISTTLDKAIKKRTKAGMPVYGTCAGCILIAKQVDSEYSLQLIDIAVSRNAYGRQLDSFQTTLKSPVLPDTEGVFIRAPRIDNAKNTTVLYSHNDEPVLVQYNNILAGTFHPELTDSTVIHKYFAKLVERNTNNTSLPASP